MDIDRLSELQDDKVFDDVGNDDDIMNDIDLGLQDGKKKNSKNKKKGEDTDEERELQTIEPQETSFLKAFYEEISEVRETIKETHALIDNLEEEYQKVSSTVRKPGLMAEMRKVFEKIRNNIKQNSSEVKKYVELLAKKNKEMAADPSKSGSAELRIRENQFKILSGEVMDLMKRYEKVQDSYKKNHEDSLKRQIKLTYQIEDDAKVEQILASKDFKEEELISGFFLGKATQHTINAEYNEIKETRDDLKDLALSMNELYDMFKDFFILLSLQQETIDSIERSINKANDYVEKGNKNLKKARKYQDKTVKAGICFSCVGGGSILIIILFALVAIPLLLCCCTTVVGALVPVVGLVLTIATGGSTVGVLGAIYAIWKVIESLTKK